MFINKLILVLLLSTILSCQSKEPIVISEPPEENESLVPELSFQTAPNRKKLMDDHLFLYKEPLLYYAISNDENRTTTDIVALNVFNQQEIWRWSDWSHERSRVCDGLVYQDKIIFTDRGVIYCINTTTGQELWRTEDLGKIHSIVENEGIIYGAGYKELREDAFLLKLNPANGHLEKFYEKTFDRSENRANYQLFEGLTFHENEQGENTIFFQERMEAGCNLIAYNLDEDTVNYQIDSLFMEGVSNRFSPIIYANKLYIMDNVAIRCLNPENGDIIWDREFNILYAGLVTTLPYFDNDVIYFLFGGVGMRALDASTGKTIYSHQHEANTSNIVEIDGKLYYTAWADGDLYCVDKATGKEIWRKSSPTESLYSDGSYYDAPIIALPEREMLLTADLFSVVVWNISEE